jgi:hypothetical protein
MSHYMRCFDGKRRKEIINTEYSANENHESAKYVGFHEFGHLKTLLY